MLQIEFGHNSFLKIFDGGSEHADLIASINKAIDGTKISSPRNQIFVVLDTSGNDGSLRFNAAVIDSKVQLKSNVNFYFLAFFM